MKRSFIGRAGSVHAPLFTLILVLSVLVTGCTTALWDKNTFAHYYRPATPPDLELFYSRQKRDVLVQYREREDSDAKVRQRGYWLELNSSRLDRGRKPQFVSREAREDLTAIPITGSSNQIPASALNGLFAVAPGDGNFFLLYSRDQRIDRFDLPTYVGSAQRVKQVLLTPFALAVDATIVGAVIGYYAAPSILQGLNR